MKTFTWVFNTHCTDQLLVGRRKCIVNACSFHVNNFRALERLRCASREKFELSRYFFESMKWLTEISTSIYQNDNKWYKLLNHLTHYFFPNNMPTSEEIRSLIVKIKNPESTSENDHFWCDATASLLAFIDDIIQNCEQISIWIPRDYSEENICILEAIFFILDNVSDINRPFHNTNWDPAESLLSLYELALSRCCAFICQALADRFHYIQKLLLKNIFSESHVRSMFASDVYMFIYRIIHPNQKTSLCQIIMNLSRLAPPDARVKAAALINRLKHPIINFGNHKYQHLIDLS